MDGTPRCLWRVLINSIRRFGLIRLGGARHPIVDWDPFSIWRTWRRVAITLAFLRTWVLRAFTYAMVAFTFAMVMCAAAFTWSIIVAIAWVRARASAWTVAVFVSGARADAGTWAIGVATAWARAFAIAATIAGIEALGGVAILIDRLVTYATLVILTIPSST